MSMDAAVVAGKFTDEILAKNFTEIGKGFNNLEGWVSHLEGHVKELYEMVDGMTKVVAKPKGMKTRNKVLIAVGVGLYLGRKSMTAEFNRRMTQVKQEAKEQYDNIVASQQNTKAPEPS